MPLDPDRLDVSERPHPSYDEVVAEFEQEVILKTAEEMRYRPVDVVYTALVERLHGRLPGVPLERRRLRQVARAISNGTLRDAPANSKRAR